MAMMRRLVVHLKGKTTDMAEASQNGVTDAIDVMVPLVNEMDDRPPSAYGWTPGGTELLAFGLGSAAGILVARPAGRWMDRSGILPVVATALATMVAAWLVLAFAAWSIAVVIGGVILLWSLLTGRRRRY